MYRQDKDTIHKFSADQKKRIIPDSGTFQTKPFVKFAFTECPYDRVVHATA